ncbi:MAG: cupin domain-containing protein [Gemmatimonadetes bacterium]|nr:cupin domain-containing protein [Gemmatimonadota bacterium]
MVVPEGVGSPWHVHPEQDEWFYVLEGEITFWVADTRLSPKAGSVGFGPKGVPHTMPEEAMNDVMRRWCGELRRDGGHARAGLVVP